MELYKSYVKWKSCRVRYAAEIHCQAHNSFEFEFEFLPTFTIKHLK